MPRRIESFISSVEPGYWHVRLLTDSGVSSQKLSASRPRGVPLAPASVATFKQSSGNLEFRAIMVVGGSLVDTTSVNRACDDRSYQNQNQRTVYASMRITPLPSLIQSASSSMRTVPNHSGAPEANASGSSDFLDQTDAGHATPHTHGSLCPRVNRKAAGPHCPHLPHINMDSMPWDILCHQSGQQSPRTSR